MSSRQFRTAPAASAEMPPGVPYIVANEAAERFSFYGMRTILVIFMTKYLHLMNEVPGEAMSEAAARDHFHSFVGWVYLTPIFGALLADVFAGKYKTIIWLSVVYCLGHGALAMMGYWGGANSWLLAGLGLIAIGSGGIKPCVSAHVGDQFGESNRHLLTKVFNWFYWSINLGAFLSTLATPWLLHWYGPHWAFGIPGALMLIATILFWMGRWKFIHAPSFLRKLVRDKNYRASFNPEAFWKSVLEGIIAILKLSIIYLFVAVFWALFDQTGSSWVFQAESMDRKFLGITWLPSQIQILNPILILTFIPLFTLIVYPFIERFFTLTPIRKISIGLFLMVAGFATVAKAQEWIDAGITTSIGWQLLAYVLITASEVMVSIVALEFSYTQAPRALKSWIMALFLVSVSLGNFFTAGVNRYIQIPDRLGIVEALWSGDQQVVQHTGLDRKAGTDDDIQIYFDGEGKRTTITIPAGKLLEEARSLIESNITTNEWKVPSPEAGTTLLSPYTDSWGNPLRYTVVNSFQCRISSLGPDQSYGTEWDSGFILKVTHPEEETTGWFYELTSIFRPNEPWLTARKRELNLSIPETGADAVPTIDATPFVGGQTRLEGAAYYWFFTWIMLGTAILFLFVVFFYKPREYFHDEELASEAPH